MEAETESPIGTPRFDVGGRNRAAQVFWNNPGTPRGAGMLSLYAARIEDLGAGDFMKVDCAAGQHVALLTPEALLRAGLSPAANVLDLKGRLRCRGCGTKGRSVVSIRLKGNHGFHCACYRLMSRTQSSARTPPNFTALVLVSRLVRTRRRIRPPSLASARSAFGPARRCGRPSRHR